MYKAVIKFRYIVCFVAFGVFSHGTVTSETAHKNQITLSEENNVCDCGPGNCSLDADGNKTCECEGKYQTNNGTCELCDCGTGTCSFNEVGKKTCVCKGKYQVHNETCELCECGQGTCNFNEDGKKICVCKELHEENNGTCELCDCGLGTCSFNIDGKKECVCEENYKENNGTCEIVESTTPENDPTTTSKDIRDYVPTDYFTSGVTEDDCYCGINSVSCYRDRWRRKVCKCRDNYAPKNETCVETCRSNSDCYNLGECRRDSHGYFFCQCTGTYAGEKCEVDVCLYMDYFCRSTRAVCIRRGDRGVCECPRGTTRSRSGICEDICDYKTCVYGLCEVTGNSSYICVCYEGFYGRHCEISSKVISYSVDWSSFIFLSVGIVIFSIASIIAVQWVKKLRRKVEDAKKLPNA